MAAQQPITARRPVAAPNARAARISGAIFGLCGAVVVLGGVASILTGLPSVAHDLGPLTGPTDLGARFAQMAPVLSAAIAALVVVAVVGLTAMRRLVPDAAAMELLVLGMVIEGCIGGAIGRIGYSADGAVLGATVACLTGGAAVVAGGIVTVLGRE